MVFKKDSRREPFDRAKILAGLKKACEKRPVSIGALGAAVDRIEKRIQDKGETEVPGREIGEEVMIELRDLDPVAYVRFASVYREFKDIDQFMDTIRALTPEKRVS
jgi:transcriptional repressor NrdR